MPHPRGVGTSLTFGPHRGVVNLKFEQHITFDQSDQIFQSDDWRSPKEAHQRHSSLIYSDLCLEMRVRELIVLGNMRCPLFSCIFVSPASEVVCFVGAKVLRKLVATSKIISRKG